MAGSYEIAGRGPRFVQGIRIYPDRRASHRIVLNRLFNVTKGGLKG